MKTMRLLLTSLTFCFLFMCQTNAQTITNNSGCWFQVKANVIPIGACIPSGFGPLFGVSPGTSITFTIPSFPPHWVVAYGVTRPMTPISMPGAFSCGFTPTLYVGSCGTAPVYATYSAGNLTIY